MLKQIYIHFKIERHYTFDNQLKMDCRPKYKTQDKI